MAWEFDSTSDYFSYPDNNVFSPATNDMSVLIWGKRNFTPSVWACGKGDSGDWEWALSHGTSGTSSGCSSWTNTGSTHNSVGAIKTGSDDGEWHSLGGKYDEPSIKQEAFRDEIAVEDTSYVANSMGNDTEDVTFGRRGDTTIPWANNGTGQLAMFIIWNKLIATIHMQALGKGCNPLSIGETANMQIWEPGLGPKQDWSGNNRIPTTFSSPTEVHNTNPPVELVEKYI
jgi:hypothetical protein